jgi:starch synthase
MDLQMVVLGMGERGLEERFLEIQKKYPDPLSVSIGYREDEAHQIQAGCDFFVMPSRFEPCGLTQMYAMRYGTLPVVRQTGGLADTVENYDEKTGTGTGFVFQDLTPRALYNVLGWACATYYDRPTAYRRLQKNAMGKDFGWSRSARAYESVYRWAMEARKRRGP